MTILLLHGLGADRSQPLELLHPALPAGSEIIAPDLRAHGASKLLGSATDFSLDALTDEVMEAVVRAGAAHKPLTVLGISLGAAIALHLTLRKVLPIDHAVFIRPAFTAEPLPDNLAAFPLIAQLLYDRGPKRGERMFRASWAFARAAQVSPASAETLAQQFHAPLAQERTVRLAEIPRNTAYRDPSELGGVIARTLVVAAERDPVHPVAVAEAWAQALPHADLVQVPSRDAGLALQQERIREHVCNWLAQL
ncbi:alpha/beta fold hydrolase [Rathayibacter toxicus]|uniref:alpha/beta fold hydrolase n=1 Tax=Rathayibacter toxicus TaxID=145458 RepID=UPI001C05A751|nr:alpha/beta fold hydrolase [Rathayibacter toxicus]QWL29608.1 alpha/beta fold hydrolase [Rathayibacter toxicus]